MIIRISPTSAFLPPNFDVLVDDVHKYVASMSMVGMHAIELTSDDESQPRFVIHPRASVLSKTVYHITLRGNLVLDYNVVSSWKSHCQCHAPSGVYDIYFHNGSRHSVYRNDVQVAAWERTALQLRGGLYEIIGDDDCDEELIIAFCLLSEYSVSLGEPSFMIGHIGPQAREFNEDWKPKVIQRVNS